MDIGKLMNGVNLGDGVDKKDLEAALGNAKEMLANADPKEAQEALNKVSGIVGNNPAASKVLDALKGFGK